MSDIRIGKVRFIDVPKGEAPLEIRRCWIGLEVACLCYQKQPSFGVNDGTFGAISKEREDFEPGYIINQCSAINELEKVHPHAAEYWNNLGFPQNNKALFTFDVGCIQVIEPVMTYEEFVRFVDAN